MNKLFFLQVTELTIYFPLFADQQFLVKKIHIPGIKYSVLTAFMTVMSQCINVSNQAKDTCI